jgi:uncharacterized protein (TIGR03067 family)
MLTKAVILVAVGLIAPEPADRDKGPDAGLKSLQGKWVVVAGEEAGKQQTDAQLKDSWVEFNGNRVRLRSPREDLNMTFTTREDSKPAQIDFKIASGPDKGKVSKGIYMIDGDSLKIAYAAPGQDRPRNFSTAKGSHQFMWVLKRAGGGK